MRFFFQEKRCSGHCCRAFIIPTGSPEDLARVRNYYSQDGQQTIDMLIYLGEDPHKLPKSAQEVVPIDNFLYNSGSHYYTCKHHNTLTGECMDYENRPKMCRNYPEYGSKPKGNGSCESRGCTRRYSYWQIFINYIDQKRIKLRGRYLSWVRRIGAGRLNKGKTLRLLKGFMSETVQEKKKPLQLLQDPNFNYPKLEEDQIKDSH